MKNTLSLFLMSVFWLFAIQACRKGCTNPKGINYNSSAKEDDASCLICDSTNIDKETFKRIVKDNATLSVHYQDSVLQVKTIIALYHYVGNDCVQQGKTTACDPDETTKSIGYATVVLTNLIEDTLLLQGNLSISLSGTPTAQRSISGIAIPPHSQLSLPEFIHFNCVLRNTISASVSATGFSFGYR